MWHAIYQVRQRIQARLRAVDEAYTIISKKQGSRTVVCSVLASPVKDYFNEWPMGIIHNFYLFGLRKYSNEKIYTLWSKPRDWMNFDGMMEVCAAKVSLPDIFFSWTRILNHRWQVSLACVTISHIGNVTINSLVVPQVLLWIGCIFRKPIK